MITIVQEIWSGRIDPEQTSIRFHQVVKEKQLAEIKKQLEMKTFSLIGFESDEGVRRNKGRVGASEAPNEIRKFLANLPYHLKETNVIDVGNITCQESELERAQSDLGNALNTLYVNNYIPIILGGGHETLYGHYLGVRKYLGDAPSIGIINIDAHFDLREDTRPTSGTMFRQILTEDKRAGYLCLGIQKFGNTQALFETAEHLGCQYLFAEDLENYEETRQTIDEFVNNYDYIILTLCMDSITESAAPGVSAPSPFGIEPKTVKNLIRYIVSQSNILSFDISEVNPRLDQDQQTLRLAAYLLAEVFDHFNCKK